MSLNIIEELTQNLILPLWNDKNLDVIDKYFALTADIRTTFLAGKGPEAIKESIQDTFKAFPIFELTIDEITQQENKLTFTWSAIATHQGTILNIKPTGKKMQFHGIVFGKLENRLIVKYHSHSNIPQVLYSNIEQPSATAFPSKSVLLDHENYEKELSDLLFTIAKSTGARLSRRELECLNLWVKGYSIKETAKQLGGLSAKTIQVFRNNIRRKFKVTSHRNLLNLLQESGILSMFVNV